MGWRSFDPDPAYFGIVSMTPAPEHVPDRVHPMSECDRLLRQEPNFSVGYGTPKEWTCICGRRYVFVDEESDGAWWQLVS